MTIPDDLKKLITHGDNTLIAELYDDRHSRIDLKTVTPKYVADVISGVKEANEGTAAEEIVRIAIKFLENKRDFREAILI